VIINQLLPNSLYSAENFSYLRSYGNEKVEKREMGSHNKVRSLFAETKVHFARAEQL